MIGTLSLTFAALMCAAPVLLGIHVLPIATFYEEWLAAVLGTAACAAAVLAARGRSIVVPQTVLWMFGLLAVLALQIVLGRVAYAQQATLAMLYVLFAMAMAWCGLQLREMVGPDRASRAIAIGLLVGGAISAALALVQAYAPASWLAGFASPLTDPRAFGNLNQANLFADQLGVSGVALLYLHLTGALRAVPAAALGLLLAIGLTLSGSRSVWLYGAWLLAWTLYLRWQSSDARYGKAVLIVAATLGVLAIFAFVLPPVAMPSADAPAISGLGRLAAMNIEAGRAGSEGVRLYFWQHAWAMLQSAPFIGVGFGQFAWAFFQQSAQFADFGIPGQERNAHNLILHLLAETGFIGAAFVVIALALWLWSAHMTRDLERWWIVAAVGIMLLHSMVEYPLWYAHFLGPFALLLGLGERRSFTPRRQRIIVVALAGAVLVGALVLGSLMQGFAELRRWVYLVPEQALRDPAIVARQSEAVQRLQPTLLGPYVDLPLTSTIQLNADNLDAKLAFNARVMAFSPIAPVVLRQVVFLVLAGRDDEAKRTLDRAAVLYPDELHAFAADLDRLAVRGLQVDGIAAYLAEKAGKN
jgi:O-antigen ligase